jgi:deoxyhypusine synthase
MVLCVVNVKDNPIWIDSEELKGTPVVGVPGCLQGLQNIGFQASILGRAVRIFQKYIQKDVNITLAITSTVATSGIREYIREFIQRYPVTLVVTTAGAVEQDLIKSNTPFILENISEKDESYRSRGINRSYNILCPNSGYNWLAEFYAEFIKSKGGAFIYSDFCKYAGDLIPDSIVGAAAQKGIPVVVPAPLDGTLGDVLFTSGLISGSTVVDVVEDHIMSCQLVTMQAVKPKLILVLGGSIPKHHACNIHISAGGADAVLLFNTELEYDGGNAGASHTELASWGKSKNSLDSAKIWGDFTITFPVFYQLISTKYKGVMPLLE